MPEIRAAARENLFAAAGLATRNYRHLHTSGLSEEHCFGIDGGWYIALLRIGDVIQIPLCQASNFPPVGKIHVLCYSYYQYLAVQFGQRKLPSTNSASPVSHIAVANRPASSDATPRLCKAFK